MSRSTHIFGVHAVEESLASQNKVLRIWIADSVKSSRLKGVVDQARAQDIALEVVPRRQLDRMAGSVPHQGVVAEVAAFVYADFDTIVKNLGAPGRPRPPLLLALDQIQDPHNFGSIIRTGYAMGADALIFPKDRSCDITPTVTRAAAGATAHLPIAPVTNLVRALEELKSLPLWIVGTDVQDARPVHDFDFNVGVALVIGSEGGGMRPLVRRTCDVLVHIPMPGHFESLNASVAAAICLYEITRQRGKVDRDFS